MDNLQVGSLVFFHNSRDTVNRAIRIAERLRAHGRPWADHVAVVTGKRNGQWLIIQAKSRGVQETTLDAEADLNGENWVSVAPPANLHPASIVAFARSQVGQHYGFLVLFSILFNIFTPRFIRVNFRRNATWICSALAAESWRAGGWIREWGDIYQTTPSQLQDAIG